jgi:hypothetical protein
MTTFADNILTGRQALTSGAASLAGCVYSRTFSLSGASGTTGFVFPAGAQNVDANLYVLTAGSAATSDDIVVSAGGTTLVTLDAIGSAVGLLRSTTAALGVLTTSSAAANSLSTTAEVSASITMVKSDQASSYQLQITFTRV